MRVIVTGGCGFIGAYVIEQLLMDGHDVVNLDCHTYAAADGKRTKKFYGVSSGGYTEHRVDIRDSQAVAAIFQDTPPDAVIHMAAETHVDRAIDNAQEFLTTNILGTHSLLEVTRVQAPEAMFCYVSTDEVYGPAHGDYQFNENDPLRPQNPYAASKAAAEHLVVAHSNTHKLRTVITRGANTYGPAQSPEKLLPMAILRAHRDFKIPVYGHGLAIREWLHVEDHAHGICLAALQKAQGYEATEVFNLGPGQDDGRGYCRLRNIAVVNAVLDRMNKPSSLVEYVADRPGHDYRYAMSVYKAFRILRWQAKTALLGDRETEGLKETIEWYLSAEGKKFWPKKHLSELLKRRGKKK